MIPEEHKLAIRRNWGGVQPKGPEDTVPGGPWYWWSDSHCPTYSAPTEELAWELAYADHVARRMAK